MWAVMKFPDFGALAVFTAVAISQYSFASRKDPAISKPRTESVIVVSKKSIPKKSPEEWLALADLTATKLAEEPFLLTLWPKRIQDLSSLSDTESMVLIDDFCRHFKLVFEFNQQIKEARKTFGSRDSARYKLNLANLSALNFYTAISISKMISESANLGLYSNEKSAVFAQIALSHLFVDELRVIKTLAPDNTPLNSYGATISHLNFVKILPRAPKDIYTTAQRSLVAKSLIELESAELILAATIQSETKE